MTKISQSQKRQYIAEGNKNRDFKKLSQAKKEEVVESIMQTDFLDLRCDWAAKKVLSDPEILKLLLNDFLPEKVESVTSINTEPKRLNRKEKNVLMDIVARTVDGREIVIEMQRFEKENFRARMFYYGAAMVRSQLPSGVDYTLLKPVYVICFMDFILKHLTDQLVYKYQMMEQSSHEVYGNWLSIFLCELPRLQKNKMAEMDYVESWLHILKESSTFVGRPEGMDARFNAVIEAAEMGKLPESEKLNYFMAMIQDKERLEYGEDRFNAGMKKGREEGREEGLTAGKREMALTMLSDGVPVQQISKWTGLSEKEIEALKG